jgi:predicted nucleic acid-binding protein
MPRGYLIDTDVLIDYLRGTTAAIACLEKLTPPLFVAAPSVAELYAGVRDGRERIALTTFLNSFETIPVNHEIAVAGGVFRRDYGKSHGTGLNDAIIAATAIFINAELVTLNRKHFPMFASLSIPYEKA